MAISHSIPFNQLQALDMFSHHTVNIRNLIHGRSTIFLSQAQPALITG